MNLYRKLGKTASVLFLALAMAGCGGGEMAVNTAPSLMLGPGGAIDEDMTGSTGLAVTATDEEGDEITFQVSDARFAVVGGVLHVVAGTMLDHEMESSISVGITANDGDLTDTKTAVVMVRNVDDNEPTMSTSGTRGNILEGETGGTGLTFMVDDNDDMPEDLMFSFSVEGFAVVDLGGGRYELEVTEALDREALGESGTVEVVVTAADDTGSVMTPTLTIAVGGKHDTAPMLGMEGMGEIDENDTGDTSVYFRPTDADGDTMLTFFVEGDNRESFRVVPAGFQVYALQVTDAFDYEMLTDGTVEVTVTVADSAGLSDTATFDVTVNDLNDNAPMITTMGNAAIDEEDTGSTMLMLGVTDADTVGDATKWTVDDTRFSVDADGYLVLNEEIDYDGADGEMSVTLQVTASDGKHDTMSEVMVTINAVNDNAPEITVDTSSRMDQMEGTFSEATSTGVTVSVMDGDGDMPMPMVDDDVRFTIDADGDLMIVAGAMFDYEMMADPSITLTITANDGVNPAEAQTVMVTIMDVNDNAPVLTVTGTQGVDPRQPVVLDEGTVSTNTPTNHRIVVSDADTHDLPRAMVNDNRFEIDENGYLTIVADSEFDFETEAKTIALQITANDGDNDAEPYTITFNIANVNEAPEISGNTRPEVVMGPYGDGQTGTENITVLTAVDPDNPDTPLSNVTWTNDNPDSASMTWSPSANRDEYTLRMNRNSFLGWGGPRKNPRHPTDRATGPYTGYTADNAGNLRSHAVTADDGEEDLRTIVQIEQTVDTITTSPEMTTRTYMVPPTAAHTRATTIGEQGMGKPANQSFSPSFDDLTGPGVFNPIATTAAAPRRLLTDADIANGIINAGHRRGGSAYRNMAAAGDAALDADNLDASGNPGTDGTSDSFASTTLPTWYNTATGVTPSNLPPVEPSGLDIVTNTRAVNVATGEVVEGSMGQLAIRYRFRRGTDTNGDGIADPDANVPNATGLDANRDGIDDGTADNTPAAGGPQRVTYLYDTDVALVDTDGRVLEEFRGTLAAGPRSSPAYQDDGVAGIAGTAGTSGTASARALDQSVWSTTGLWPIGTLPIEVDVTDDGDNTGAETPVANSLSYAKYGFWSYNNTRGCTAAVGCPVQVGTRAGGLRGATAFGLMSAPESVNAQSHVGVWKGRTVAFWGQKADNGSIAPDTMGSNTGPATVVVDFGSDRVQANMEIPASSNVSATATASGFEIFRFEGMLDPDRLGYTASIDTTIGGGAGVIEGQNVTRGPARATGRLFDVNANGLTDDGTSGGTATPNHVQLAIDNTNNVKAMGELSGAFYGPSDPLGTSIAQNAQAPTETAGTWRITDVPDPGTNPTIVIGAFGADLLANTRMGANGIGSGTGNLANITQPMEVDPDGTPPVTVATVGDYGLIVDDE